MSLDSRSTHSAHFKRAEQLKRWEQSDTNRESSVINGKSRRIKFSAGCVFLAACAAGDKEEVLSLLKKGADVDTTNVDGLSALHQACIDDNLDMVEFLIEQGADINKGDNEGWTPLHATASCGFISIARYLIEKGANVAAVNHDGELPVDIAESDAMEDMLQKQIEDRGIDAEDARLREQRLMLADAKNWLSSGSVNENLHPKTGATSLHVAAAKGYINVMDVLLEAGCDVNAQDFDGWTPLHAAAHWAQKEACRLLVEHFCDMDAKNCVGQTAYDVADSQIVSCLEELRKLQSSLSRDSFINKKKNNNNIQEIETTVEPKKHNVNNEEEEVEEEKEEDKTAEVAQVEVEIQPVVPAPATSRPGVKNFIKDKTANKSSALVDINKQVPNATAVRPANKVQSAVDEDTSQTVSSWRRNRLREDLPKLNLPLRINEQEASKAKPETPPTEVVLRRTQSFEADEKFYNRYLELRAKINAANNVINSPLRTASLKEKHFSRRGLVNKEESVTSEVTNVTPTVSEKTPPTAPRTPPTASPPSQPVSSSTTTPSSSPTQKTNQVRRSFVPPVRDDESETQRKAHAKRVRETRRSTQGVTLEEIKSAEQLVKKKQREAANSSGSPQSQDPPTPDAVFTFPSPLLGNNSGLTSRKENDVQEEVAVSATVKTDPKKNSVSNATATVSAVIVKDDKSPPASVVGERRPSWRLKVNNGSKFMLEDARVNDQDSDSRVSLNSQEKKSPYDTSGDTTVTIPLRKSRTDDRDQDKENEGRSGLATQGVIQRRRRPKRRSTGVVHVDMDEIDPGRASNTSRDSDVLNRVNSIESDGEKDKRDESDNNADDSESASENGDIDYKKLYEESQKENRKLQDKLKKVEDDLSRAKMMSEKTPYVPMRNSLSEAEKREKRAMERKLSEMEEELKQLQKLKADNERLRAENRALTRVVSKLTAAQNATRTTQM